MTYVKQLPPEQLCLTCIHAVPTEKYGCAWSLNFEPIDEWVAREREFLYNWTSKTTWHVYACPKYKNEYGIDAEMCDEEVPYRNLSIAIVKRAAQDYRAGCERERKIRDEFPNVRAYRGKHMKPWRRWIHVEAKPYVMKECEQFFTSEFATAITPGDPMYIMDLIREESGLEPFESVEK